MSKLQRIFNAEVAPDHGVRRNMATSPLSCQKVARALVSVAAWAVLLSACQSATFAAGSADISVTISASIPSELVYTAVVINNGPNTAQHVSLQGQLPPGVVNVSVTPSTCTFLTGGGLKCGLGAMVPNASQTVVVTVHPTTTGDKTAQVTVASELSDPSPSNNSASATQTITSVGISDVAVAMSTPNPITLGGRLTYNVTITNLGDDDAQNVLFVDAVPGTAQIVAVSSSAGSCTVHADAVNCPIGHLAVQGSATVRITMVPNVAGAFYNTSSATPSATSGAVDPNLTNNSVTTVTFVNP
jgi:uncharacterized repeat protein (TIGR01451 family)